jgi:hypothetical protein
VPHDRTCPNPASVLHGTPGEIEQVFSKEQFVLKSETKLAGSEPLLVFAKDGKAGRLDSRSVPMKQNAARILIAANIVIVGV